MFPYLDCEIRSVYRGRSGALQPANHGLPPALLRAQGRQLGRHR